MPDALRAVAAAPLPAFSYAFQPIVNAVTRCVVAYEALVRGPQGQPAGWVFGQIDADALHTFDQHSHDVAIRLAARLDPQVSLFLNFMPQTLAATDAPLLAAVATARECALPLTRLCFEITENQAISDLSAFAVNVNRFRALGVKVAIDDFGAGHSGLNLLADFQPDLVKLDMNLVRGIERRGPRQAIARAILGVCMDLGIEVLAEGVETAAEMGWFRSEGVTLFQGFYLASPGFEQLPPWPRP